MSLPHYHLVPKHPVANVAFRADMRRRGIQETKWAKKLIEMCREDYLFYINTMVFIQEPRPGLYWPAPCVPMITWGFQDAHLAKIHECYGKKDLVTDKVREMSGTWNHLVYLDWRWRFYDENLILLVSRDKEMVDRYGDPDALMQKLDYISKHMPKWMPPGEAGIRRNDMIIENLLNGSSFTGEATTADVGVGGRKTSVFCDEVARWKRGSEMMMALRGVTNNRFICSTHKGNATAFAESVRKAKREEMEYFPLHWSLHPHKSLKMWRDGSGKMRSPWYDAECKKCFTKAEIAAELDMDPFGSQTQFFDPEMIDDLKLRLMRQPLTTGEIEYQTDTMAFRGWQDAKSGRWRLWFKPDAGGKPPQRDHMYVMGADVSAGTGATNSALVVSDLLTREKVAEFTTPFLRPDEFADMAVAAANWFTGYLRGTPTRAFLAWEANGPGRIFGDRVLELGYGNIYYRESEDKLSRKKTDMPGWWNTPKSMEALLGDLRKELARGTYIERSERTLEEYRLYVHAQDGSIVSSNSEILAAQDPSGAGDNHADLVIATALSVRGMRSMGKTEQIGDERKAPEGSLAWRMKMHKEQEPVEEKWDQVEEWDCDEIWAAA